MQGYCRILSLAGGAGKTGEAGKTSNVNRFHRVRTWKFGSSKAIHMADRDARILEIRSSGSGDFHARLRAGVGFQQPDVLAARSCGEDHALGQAELHLSRFQVGHHHGKFAYQPVRHIG